MLIVATTMLCSCEKEVEYEGNRYITLKNNSNADIGCLVVWEQKVSKNETYKVTTKYKLAEGSSIQVESHMPGKNWKEDFKVIPNIRFLIMDGELFNEYYDEPLETIENNVPTLAEYTLSLPRLEKINWTINYPDFNYLLN